MYRIDIMTLFPDVVGDMLCESVLGRGQERGYIRVECHQIRDYTVNRQKQVDNYPYGGGRGAVMQADPLYRCWEHICQKAGERVHTIYMSPAGKTFTQADARRLKDDYSRLILVCGHYEGIDERFIEECVDEEISIGDFVMTGGEIPAMAVADAVCRLVPGVLSDPSCYENESHWNGMLEAPQYSRPEVWHGRAVPPVLLSGNHAKVDRWRRKMSILRTRQRRPDLYEKLDLSSREDQKLMKELEEELRFERFTSTDTPDYPRAMELYRISFPCHELREEDSQVHIMGHPEYHFDAVYEGTAFIGLMLYWETECFIYVEHFCILPSLRGKKYGQRALELLERRGKTVILEIDPPVDEVSVRRKSFYERCGYRVNPYPHDHPPYHADFAPHRLVVMSCPEPLEEGQYIEFARYLREVVMEGH